MDDSEFHDLAEPNESPTPRVPPEKKEREGVPWAAILMAVWAIVLVIFSVQNADDAAVQFLGWSF